MVNWIPFMEMKIRSGKTITKGEITVTPEAQSLIVKLPFWGFVWHRPVALVVEKDGRQERIPIFDATRAAVWGMVVIGTAVSLMVMFTGLMRRMEENG